MPENETLIHDERTASRWRPVKARMDAGLAPIEAFATIRDHFYMSLQNVWRQWKELGVGPAKLFGAALNDSNRLHELIRQIKFDRNAQLLRDVARDVEATDREGLVKAFLDAAWESVHTQLQLDCREEPLSPEFLSRKQEMLDHIRKSLVKNPSRFPSRKQKLPPPDMDTRLGENLL